MDIRDWPLDKIMQLPACCFGHRWPACCQPVLSEADTVWDISELGLPDVCVLWELDVVVTNIGGRSSTVRLALGAQLPTTTAMMDALEPLIPGLGIQGAEPRTINFTETAAVHVSMKKLLYPQGRRLVVEVTPTAVGSEPSTIVSIVVSRIPTEVPDWLVSANLRSR